MTEEKSAAEGWQEMRERLASWARLNAVKARQWRGVWAIDQQVSERLKACDDALTELAFLLKSETESERLARENGL